LTGNAKFGVARRRLATIQPLGLEAILGLPAQAPAGVVIFAHGSGSSRLSPRNRSVADALQAAGLATLLFDLLNEAESADRQNVFDIPLLADRLVVATEWVEAAPETHALPIGYFGASTGAAAALVAAAQLGNRIAAVVSRGGRPDLAGEALTRMTAPTLLIVGGADAQVLALNQAACNRMHCARALEVVPDATHLFEEPGALEKVVALARRWFLQHLAKRQTGVLDLGQ
jgi:alpha-beta hydrolase superfamily lysophospholipase